MKASNNTQDCAAFRRWLYALTRSELLHAMEVDCSPSETSQEYDLLMEMVELQPPPPTPIHPAAVGFRPAGGRRGLPGERAEKERLRRMRPRLFQWSERHSYRPRSKGRAPPRFDMIARKKVTPWGQVLGVGRTREQRDADDEIVRGTFIRKAPGTLNRSFLAFRDDQNKSSSSCESIIRMLQVASRGYFLTTHGKSSLPFCTPWLQPTERWFSLSFYLASRYHVALWKSFSAQSPKQTPTQYTSSGYDAKILSVAIPAAVRQALLHFLPEDAQNWKYLRDTMIWDVIIHENTSSLKQQKIDWGEVWDSLIYTPLIQASDKDYSRLKLQIVQSLEHTLASEIAKTIMEDTPRRSQPAKSSKSKKKRKKGGKRGRQKESRRVSFEEATNNNDNTEESSASEKEQENAVSALNKSYEFPTNNVQPHERNRNIVFALGILDGVLEQVFTTVGLSPTESSFHATLIVEKPEKKGRSMEANKRSLDPERREGVNNNISRRSPGAKDGKPLKRLPGEGKHPKKAPPMPVVRGKQPIGGKNGKNPPEKHEENGYRMFPLSTQQDERQNGPRHPFGVDWSVGPSFPPSHVQPIFLTDETTNVPSMHLHRPQGTDDYPFVTGNEDHFSPMDGWPFLSRYHGRDQSILTDFFETQEERIDDDEKLMAASTAASISSSTYKDAMVVAEADEDETDKESQEDPVPPVEIVGEIETGDLEVTSIEEVIVQEEDEPKTLEHSISKLSAQEVLEEEDETRLEADSAEGAELQSNEDTVETAPSYPPECRSPSPEPPRTPPPTLSPILVSLADLKKLKKTSLTPKLPMKLAKSKSERAKRSSPMVGLPGSLPNSPVPPNKNGLTPSWSREDLRIAAFQDDTGIKQNRSQIRPSPSEQQQTYRAAAIKYLAKPIASSKGANFDFRGGVTESPSRKLVQESCAHSETALDGHAEEQQWHSEGRRQVHDDIDNKSATKDETTTITSALSHREPEDQGSVRDERNSFRDMCLTLGAEVAKLKAMLAAQRAASVVAPVDFQDNIRHSVYNPGRFDPNAMSPFFHGFQRGGRFEAMSDAGIHRGGDHESQVSEDEVYSEAFSKARADAVRRMSSSATVPGSDASIENNGSTSPGITLGAMPVYDSVTLHGLQSRLTKDILRFLNATSMQLRKQDTKRRIAVERFSRLVNTIWPRAQVKLYGSHVSGLCLPSSDLDFVICLPAVHKKAPALAPGVLEGRNAINETSQKLLARELKGESWVDPRSIKLIERTVVPVIKVSTKDTRARMLQLDISFDSPEHHGLHANQMVAQILEELPLVRPLMLVLKQFLLDRGLLTAYTGGLSSYCLFLMVARYLQEQSPTCLDCGSLLMGFLDFHGNHFDPRATGISVYRRQYFARPNYAVASYQEAGQPMWFPPNQHHVVPASPPPQGPQDFRRRNSFSDTGSVDGKRRSQTPTAHQRPPRFQPTRFNAAATHAVEHADVNRSVDHGRPFTFDPLFVEDPLSAGNNVGRNAFRIFQVQRSFSDAHRALVASLEWDIHSSGDLNDADYPLLKCLLHSEDVLYEL